MIRKGFLVALMLAFCLFGRMAFAQTDTGDEISVSVTPSNPGPDEPVTVSLQSYSVDLPSSTISWVVDGKGVLAGVGNSNYTITTKGLGVSTDVRVLVTPVGQLPIAEEVVVTPMSVDILWEATDSTVPPLYRGRAMPTSESEVKFVAIPEIMAADGTLEDANTLVYNWQENYVADDSTSGYDKDSISYDMDYLNPTKHVSVTVSSRDGTQTTSNELDISPVTPKVLWYAGDSTDGTLFNTALPGEYTVPGDNVFIVAEPYFFSPGDPSSPQLSYQWTLNGSTATPPPDQPNELFLQRQGTETGDAEIDLTLENTTKLFQEFTGSLILHLK